jgi:hypothetical protein
MTEKTYVVMDIQDVNDYWTGTLKDVAEFLANFWGNDEEMTESEFDAYIDELQDDEKTENTSNIDSKLQGIGYTLFESEEDRLEWVEENL